MNEKREFTAAISMKKILSSLAVGGGVHVGDVSGGVVVVVE
jgi:hypothetical protein